MDRQYRNLRLPYRRPDRRASDDSVLLEQEPWDPYVGYLTRLGVIAYLNALLFEGPEVVPNCAYVGGGFSKAIYAYPSRPDLNYQAACSWGTLGERQVRELLYTEVINCNLEQEHRLRYPALEIVRDVWAGPEDIGRKACSADGEAIEPPAVSIDEDGVHIAAKVHGTLLVTYKVMRHTYPITITPRPEAIENRMQSFVYALWSGGNTWLEVEPPDEADDDDCRTRGGGGHFNPPDDRPESVPPEDIYKKIDYCSGLEIAE